MVKFFGKTIGMKVIILAIILTCCLATFLILFFHNNDKSVLIVTPADWTNFDYQIVDAVGEQELTVIFNNQGTDQVVKLSWNQNELAVDEDNFHVKNATRITDMDAEQRMVNLNLLGNNVYSIKFNKLDVNKDYSINAEE